MTSIGARAARLAWDLDRFGLSPSKLPLRVMPGSAPKLLCISIPKSGTHLLERALCLHPRLYRALRPTINEKNQWADGGPKRKLGHLRPGQVLMAHLPFHWFWHGLAVEHNIARVLMVRDPRAVLLSEVEWLVDRGGNAWQEQFVGQPDIESRIRLALTGIEQPFLRPFAARLDQYVEWLQTDIHRVRFEDLIGAAGGGGGDDDDRQRTTLAALFEHVGLHVDDHLLAKIQAATYSDKSPTFNQGRVARWRDVFSPALQRDVEEAIAGPLEALGYTP